MFYNVSLRHEILIEPAHTKSFLGKMQQNIFFSCQAWCCAEAVGGNDERQTLSVRYLNYRIHSKVLIFFQRLRESKPIPKCLTSRFNPSLVDGVAQREECEIFSSIKLSTFALRQSWRHFRSDRHSWLCFKMRSRNKLKVALFVIILYGA